ncbi:MAG: 4a-hydroxytetrahydrobiopterin dehydratase [Micrococcus sp.]|nr:4a-hydroxytetrahydrobiopterin dehydratase [Micrococcus sp.]
MSFSADQPTLTELAQTPGRQRLEPAQVQAALAAEPSMRGWSVSQAELRAAFSTGDFVTALRLTAMVGEAAETANHHPDLLVSYGRLGVRMHSHDVGALTSRDVRLARTISQLAHGLALHAEASSDDGATDDAERAAHEPGADEQFAVYGTLAPGRPNAHIMAGLRGAWREGVVHGHLHESGWGAASGYPGIVLDDEGPAVHTFLFTSADLPTHWDRLDAFEGPGYQRTQTAVVLEDGRRVTAWIYALAEDAIPG